MFEAIDYGKVFGHRTRPLKPPGFKVDDGIGACFVVNLDGLAADLTVFNVSLVLHRGVEDHRDFLPAIRTGEEVFHAEYIINARARMKT